MTDLGTIRSYDDLQAVCRAVAEQRQMSRTEIDRLAGFAPGLAAKLLSDPPVRHMGRETLPGMLGALGIKLVPIDDAVALARYTARADTRNGSQVRHAKSVLIKISARKAKRGRRKGGKNSRKYMTRFQARKLARKAGKAGAAKRWGRAAAHGLDTSAIEAPRSQAPASLPPGAGTAAAIGPTPQP